MGKTEWPLREIYHILLYNHLTYNSCVNQFFACMKTNKQYICNFNTRLSLLLVKNRPCKPTNKTGTTYCTFTLLSPTNSPAAKILWANISGPNQRAVSSFQCCPAEQQYELRHMPLQMHREAQKTEPWMWPCQLCGSWRCFYVFGSQAPTTSS